MRTVKSLQPPEFVALQDLAEAMEVSAMHQCLPSSEWLALLDRFIERLDSIGQTQVSPLNNNNSPDAMLAPAALDHLHQLGADMYKASFRWPAGNIFEPGPAERQKTLEQYANVVGEHLAAYDAHRYMGLMASISPSDKPSLTAGQRHSAFCHTGGIDEALNQESVALWKWHISDVTKGAVAPPGPRDAFDPRYVTIERLSTAIIYDGQTLGDFQDNAILHPLGHYVPEMSESQAIKVAREIFYHGHEGAGCKPLNESSLSDMVKQVENDYEQAMTESLHSIDKGALGSIPAQLARFKESEPHPSQYDINNPGMS